MSISAIVASSFINAEGCWIWRGAPRNGYGRIANRAAHRVSYTMWHGQIPKGHHVHHICGQKRCVNPRHLEAVSARDHMLDRHASSIPVAIAAARAERRRQQRALTHCINGHEFTPENTYVRKEGWRQCRACLRERARRSRV